MSKGQGGELDGLKKLQESPVAPTQSPGAGRDEVAEAHGPTGLDENLIQASKAKGAKEGVSGIGSCSSALEHNPLLDAM